MRAQFVPGEVAARRQVLGLQPDKPVLLVTGGSQGASGLNDLLIQTLPHLARLLPDLQLVHLAGPNDVAKVEAACAAHKFKAVVKSFFEEMPVALGAADVVVSRAGASSLAELAAMRVPAILVPFPAATDNHQLCNAQAWEKTGAARVMEQRDARPEVLAAWIGELAANSSAHTAMQAAQAQWHRPDAAEQIAETILQTIAERRRIPTSAPATPPPGLEHRQSAIT